MVQGVFDIDSADMVREVGWRGGEGVDGVAASAAAPAPAPARERKDVKGDRKIIPQNLWEMPDGQVIQVPDFCGDDSFYPGVPVENSRPGVCFDSWSECVQDRTLLPG